MACFEPLKGYRSRSVNPTGKRSIVFNKNDGYVDMPVELPCGQCLGCRLDRSKAWAVRIMMEASQHAENSFITLTYSEESVPKDGSLRVEDFQLFMKRLRKRLPLKIRFFHCGEYGERLFRPHYHACIFGWSFKQDRYLHTIKRGQKHYRSPLLEETWQQGHTIVGDLTFESAAYVARYITKKITGDRAEDYYTEIDRSTGEVLRELKPEYVTMSRRPGIGKTWFEKYNREVFPDDFVVIKGRKYQAPKYFLQALEQIDREQFHKTKARRMYQKEVLQSENTAQRLQTRLEVLESKTQRLKRNYENETENV